MYKLKSCNIKDFAFSEFKPLKTAEDMEALALEMGLKAYNSWMLPQIVAHYGQMELVWGDGLVDPMATAQKNIRTDWDIGLWRVVTMLKRGSLVKQQSKPEFANYSALVPLILSGVKKFQGVPYSKWFIKDKCPLIDAPLLEAMLFKDVDICSLGSERLLELRQLGLTTKSGDKKGSIANPTSQWCLRGIQGTELAYAPKLVSTMLTQIWVAHPSLRSEYMILNPLDWDSMPDPIISTDLFKKPEPSQKSAEVKIISAKLPWDLS